MLKCVAKGRLPFAPLCSEQPTGVSRWRPWRAVVRRGQRWILSFLLMWGLRSQIYTEPICYESSISTVRVHEHIFYNGMRFHWNLLTFRRARKLISHVDLFLNVWNYMTDLNHTNKSFQGSPLLWKKQRSDVTLMAMDLSSPVAFPLAIPVRGRHRLGDCWPYINEKRRRG